MSSNKLFQSTPVPRPKRNTIDLSHEKKLTCDMGELRVIYSDDIIPGDSFSVQSEVFIRFGPMLAPVLHRIDAYVHYFFVPYRQIFKYGGAEDSEGGWEDFITGHPEDPNRTATPPTVQLNDTTKVYFGNQSLTGDFGLPGVSGVASVTQNIDINVLPFVAYQWIWDNYYRDENLQSPIVGPLGNFEAYGGDLTTYAQYILTGQYRNWEKDYFTSALPTAYKGLSSDVELDLDVYGNGISPNFTIAAGASTAPTIGDAKFDGTNRTLQDAAGNPVFFRDTDPTVNYTGISATLEMLELRRAQALLRYYEAANRGGHRYVEHLLGIYGVVSDDARLQIPQYLGGGKQNIQISEVLNASQTFDPTTGVNDGVGGVPVTIDPQASMAGKGLSMGKTNRFSQTFKEHGIVLGILSILPRTGYNGGIPKMFLKEDRFDYFIPQLQHIGEQEIKQVEVYYDPVGTDKDDTFGYTPRYAEYKFKSDSVSGLFSTSMDYWHCNRMIDSAPALNESFIKADPSNDEMSRIFAAEQIAGVDNIFVQVYNSVRAKRPMSLYSVPK